MTELSGKNRFTKLTEDQDQVSQGLDELMRMILIFYEFCLKHCWFFNFLFFRFKETFFY